MPAIKSSGESSPRSTAPSRSSHSAVSFADFSASGITLISSVPFSVGRSCFFFRSTKPERTSFSITPARVAGVPSPLRSTSSNFAKSSALACSIAESSVSSVKWPGGEVAPSLTDAPSAVSFCPSVSAGSGGDGSACFGFCFSVAWKACSKAVQPAAISVLPLAEKTAPPHSSVTAVSA